MHYKSLKDKGHESLFKKTLVRHSMYSHTFFLHLYLKLRTNFFPAEHFDLSTLKKITLALPCTRIWRTLIFIKHFLNS